MLSLREIQEGMQKLKDWSLEGSNIVKNFNRGDFKGSMEFINKVAEISDKHSHYPDVLISSNMVRLSLTTHEARSVTEKDFQVAEDIDKLE